MFLRNLFSQEKNISFANVISKVARFFLYRNNLHEIDKILIVKMYSIIWT